MDDDREARKLAGANEGSDPKPSFWAPGKRMDAVGPYVRHCRVCGLRYTSDDPDDLPWGRGGASPKYWVCVCCATEDGYEDNSPESARGARERWLAQGAPWFVPKFRPPDWDLEKQLAQVPADYR